ncbi:MAG: 3-hydroxybutyrate dehydrogenase [Candidatus Eremiobacteraeota bacterium]|nr:3-hydroxybutyrate dehydrogenase [Candidatus Eremiobacteraeota bacterium]
MSSIQSSTSSKRTASSFIALDGRVSVITGGSRGIGAAAGLELAKAGSSIALIDIDEGSASRTAGEIAKQTGVTARAYAASVTDRATVTSTLARIAQEFGGIDHLVNNAGIQFVNPLDTFPDDKWDLVRSIDLDGVFNMTKAVWPHLVARGRGRIVNLASVQGIIATEYKIAYVASKHGVIGITQATALEGAPLGITANAVCPGAVLTDLVKNQAPELARSYGGITEEEALERAFLVNMPTKRFIMPDEIGQLITYLCTDAAKSITGAAIAIDGGWTAH